MKTLKSAARDFVVFYLNGVRTEVRGLDVFKTVAEYLRYSRGLTGTKIVCAEGDCGACTILRARPGERLEAINSCIALVAQLDLCHVVTIEGIAREGQLSPVQNAMVQCHGSQCGYCTPGFVMAMSWMFEHHKTIDEKCARNHLTGNLCRCTGYQPILDAALAVKNHDSLTRRYIVAAHIKNLARLAKRSVAIKTEHRALFMPVSLKELSTYRKRHPDSLILGAATDLGVLLNKGKHPLTHLVSLTHLRELNTVRWQRTRSVVRVSVGANVTLSQLRKQLEKKAPAVAATLDLFASPQIKNVATLAGNVANASPIGDTLPILLALDASVRTQTRSIPIDQFFIGYRKTALKKGEIIRAIEFTIPRSGDFFRFFKTSQRKDLDISCVNAALFARKSNRGFSELRIAYGGVAATPLRLKRVETLLRHQVIAADLIERAIAQLAKDITPRSDLRGSEAYRLRVSQNILRELLTEAAAHG